MAQTATTETTFDPPPQRGRLRSNEKQSGSNGDRVAAYELPGFAIGKAVHADVVAFCRRVNRELTTWDRNGWRIDRVVIRGYADGIPNRGVEMESGSLPIGCRRIVGKRVDDLELARLRACLVRETLFSASGTKYPTGVQSVPEAFDEPDGGASGPKHRKVKVEIILANERRSSAVNP